MVFSAPVFLFVFLPACLALAFVARLVDRSWRGAPPAHDVEGQRFHPVQNAVLLILSIAFYVYGSGWHVAIMLGSILVSWLGGLIIGLTPWRRAGLWGSIGVQLGVLGYYKYANFFVDQMSAVANWLGAPPLPWTPVLLPIGVSFFVFQGISYTIDVSRGVCPPRRNILSMALFKALFPQLIAGPIVRYTEVARELDRRPTTLDEITGGAVRFIYGLCKKVIVADAVGELADAAFGTPLPEVSNGVALVGAFAYTFQIYFDFSAYSDMAIGIGRMFGFHFPENFRRPLATTSITDFWRRWHMTLSFWFRDYLYRALGGSRVAPWKTYRNLWIVFLLSGLWHGASWTFVAWGAYHGALLTLERLFRRDRAGMQTGPARVLQGGITFVLVVVGFTVFRAESFEQALVFYKNMVVPSTVELPLAFADHLTHRNLLLLLVSSASLFLPLDLVLGRFLAERHGALGTSARLVVLTVGALYAAALISSNHFSPFIYFRF